MFSIQNTMNMKCVLCKNTKFVLVSTSVRDSKKHRIIKCKNCAHVQLHPLPSELSYKKFYDDNRQIKNIKFNFKIEQLEKKSEFDVKRRLEIIKKKSHKRSRILEIGSGNGFLLKKMYNSGYDITGIEISKERRDISRKLSNAPVLDYNVFDGLKSLGQFDLVLLFQVFEHVTQPINFLKILSKFLKKNGTIIIEVPNVNDFQLDLNQFYQNWFWQKAHVNYFSEKILTKILKKLHFQKIEVKGIQRYSIENMFNWKITSKPQPIRPTYELPAEYCWIENNYKNYLQKNLICDTIMVIAKNVII